MRRFANEQFLYGLFSLVIATVMWLYVATAQNPLVDRVMTVDLHVRGLSPNEVVVQAPNRVQVRLQGPRSALAVLSPMVLDASVDLAGLRPGTHRVPVDVATPPDMRVVERTQAPVVLDTMTRQRLPVEVSLIGTPPEGITLGPPRVSPAHVVVSGAATQVEEVRRALVTLDTTTLRQQLVTSLTVRLMDANGQEVRGLTVEPLIVEATLPVREGVITKIVPVVPTIVGTPSPGLMVSRVTTDPATVALTGPGSLLAGIQAAATSPVDLSGVRGDLSRRVALALPGGVSAPTDRVTVVVRVGRALLSTVFRAVPVRVVGAPAGTVSHVVPDRVEVQVEGPQDLLQGLSSSTVTVEVDAAGQKPGQHRVAPRAVLPPGVRLLAIRPARVVVILTLS